MEPYIIPAIQLFFAMILLALGITLYTKINRMEERARRATEETLQRAGLNDGALNALHANNEYLQRAMAEGFKGMREETMNTIVQSIQAQNDILRHDALAKNQLLHQEAIENEKRMEHIRHGVERQLARMNQDNKESIEEIRTLVDKRLQATLETRITESFQLVNDRLEQVYKGLGEMQSLASGVGDLKKVLSNVKTRGVLGEVQLAALLSDILTVDQYEANVATKRNSKNYVEFAVKLPGGAHGVYLPIDSKLPLDAYEQLLDAYENGSKEALAQARQVLSNRVRSFARDIAEKYIDVPNTTEFAVLFLPFEGLYGEVLNLGLFDELQRKHRIILAGPTTLAALLNSLQMGFHTLAIQKKSQEVWSVLAGVKQEFGEFEAVLNRTQKKLEAANADLDKLIGVRTRSIRKRLGSIQDDIELRDAESGNVEEENLEPDRWSE